MFDEYLRERAARLGGRFEPFDLVQDYKKYVDGKPRHDGLASFLQSRSIYLPYGTEGDPPGRETICGLGNQKTQRFLEAIRQRGVEVYQTSIDFIRRVKSRGLRVAVVTSSRNCSEVLEAAGISDLFDAQVDGVVAHEWMLDGKPAPDTYLEAARRLGVKPRRAAVIEDAASGVQAGKAGHFGLVVGISRNGFRDLLQQSGADLVLSDLGQLELAKEDQVSTAIAPLALERLVEIRTRIRNRRVAVFLDYDGTLTPIVERPELAVMSADMRATLKALADCCTVVVISGRERSDVQRLVGLNNVIYAGCHGFDIAGPRDTKIQHEEGAGYVPVLAQAAHELHRRLAPIEGAIVENKTYAVAVHFRLVKAEDLGRVEHAVDSVLAQHSLLRKTSGKKVFELRPNLNWDKGKAVLWLLDALSLNEADLVPIYLGDDVTDRDAFRALHGKGISILVADQPQATCADYRLSDTAEVRAFLNELTAIRSESEANE
jgi:alpha,alpha-trehalase